MLKSSLLVLLLLPLGAFTAINITDQTERISWVDMEDVVVVDRYDKILESYILSPIFGEHISSFDGKTVEITGYVVFVSEENNVVMLSRNDFSSCFFCGGAGPESVVEVYMTPDMPELERDRVISVKGTFKLNPDDPTKNFYLMNDGIVIDK
jgi:hypothetical protein